MMRPEPYLDNIGLLGEISRDLRQTTRFGKRPLSRHRESKDAYNKKKASKKMAKASHP